MFGSYLVILTGVKNRFITWKTCSNDYNALFTPFKHYFPERKCWLVFKESRAKSLLQQGHIAWLPVVLKRKSRLPALKICLVSTEAIITA